MEAEFSLIDVFSDRPSGGNQLAVFPRAEGLSDEVMQQLAREFNFAESTFVLPSSDPACTHRVRIFTPRTELPFAGHPTASTAAILASRNPGSSQFLFEEGICLMRSCRACRGGTSPGCTRTPPAAAR